MNYKEIIQDRSFIIGDADMNGVININDVTFIQRYFADPTNVKLSSSQKLTADANHDGEINVSDATFQYLLGISLYVWLMCMIGAIIFALCSGLYAVDFLMFVVFLALGIIV